MDNRELQDKLLDEITELKIHMEELRYLALETLDRLKQYEDAEEQGLLLRLPCKVGDKVYVIAEEWEDCYLPNSKYYEIYEDTFSLYMFEDVGERVFLTKEEAEQKLAEMKGE